MLQDLLYNYPIWAVGGVIIALSVTLSWIGLYLFDGIVDVSIRRQHNDVAGFIIAIIGVVYAVLLAFIAVAAWQSFDQANQVVQEEANLVGNLYRDSVDVPQPERNEIRQALKDYLDLVIGEEWPAQQAGRIDPQAWQPVAKLHDAIAAIDAKTLSQSVVEAEILKTLNALYSARRARLLAAQNGIPATIWWILMLGAIMTTSFSFFFGTPNMTMHYAMTGALAASMALVLVLIVALDWPFRGSVSVSAEAYEAVQASMIAAPDER